MNTENTKLIADQAVITEGEAGQTSARKSLVFFRTVALIIACAFLGYVATNSQSNPTVMDFRRSRGMRTSGGGGGVEKKRDTSTSFVGVWPTGRGRSWDKKWTAAYYVKPFRHEGLVVASRSLGVFDTQQGAVAAYAKSACECPECVQGWIRANPDPTGGELARVQFYKENKDKYPCEGIKSIPHMYEGPKLAKWASEAEARKERDTVGIRLAQNGDPIFYGKLKVAEFEKHLAALNAPLNTNITPDIPKSPSQEKITLWSAVTQQRVGRRLLKKWDAKRCIVFNKFFGGKRYDSEHLGTFDTPQEAHEAYYKDLDARMKEEARKLSLYIKETKCKWEPKIRCGRDKECSNREAERCRGPGAGYKAPQCNDESDTYYKNRVHCIYFSDTFANAFADLSHGRPIEF
jgi:hypothetical protein